MKNRNVRRSRWSNEFERYGGRAYPRDSEGVAHSLIVELYREPISYHQGAKLRGRVQMTDARRKKWRKVKTEIRDKLDKMAA